MKMKMKAVIVAVMLAAMLLSGCGAAKPAGSVTTLSPVLAASIPATKKKSKRLNKTIQYVPKYGDCYFIPERDDVGTWYFLSPKMKQYTIEQMRDRCPPSFGALPDTNGGLWIYNIGTYLDRWMVVCKFSDGSTSNKGKIVIDYTLPEEAVIMHPIMRLYPTATPAPQPTEVIALNTKVHIVPELGECYFYTDRDDANTWYFIDPNGKRFTIAQMRTFCPPSFGARPSDDGGLWIYNIGKYLDGYSVMCVYPDGVVSEPGLIKIDYSLPAEAVMMHPM